MEDMETFTQDILDLIEWANGDDPETKSLFTSDFITQFNCVEGGSVFPPADSIKGDSAQRLELRLFFTSHYGADDNAMQLEVYPLERTLVEGTPYYTNLNPVDYLADGAEPIARKAYTALDYALDDDVLSDEDHYHNVCIPLPTQMGTDIIRDYRLHRDGPCGCYQPRVGKVRICDTSSQSLLQLRGKRNQ